MAETIQRGMGDEPPARFPLPAGQIVAAIYRIVFSRRGDHDVFANAAVKSLDFIVPVILFAGFHLVYEVVRDARLQHAIATNARAAAIILGVLAAGALLRLLVAAAVTGVLARGFAEPGRIKPGLLGFVWMEAVLVSPWIIILRSGVSGHDPVWMIVAFGFVPMLFLIYGAARVMRVAFGLSNLGLGFLFALAGSIISYLIDNLIPW